MVVPETNNVDCTKMVESTAKFIVVNMNILKTYRIQSKIENKSRKIIAEVQTNKCKMLMIEIVSW